MQIFRLLCSMFIISLLLFPGIQAGQAGRQDHEVTVRLVLVDAIVVDRAGRVVDDLGPEDFVLTEDGKDMPLQSADFIDLRPSTTGETPSRRFPVRHSFFVVVDSINTIRRMLDRRRSEITAGLTDLARRGGRVLVAEIDSEKGLEILQPLTEDPESIAKGIDAAAGSIWVEKTGDSLKTPGILEGQTAVNAAEFNRQIYEMESRARFEKTLAGMLAFMNLIKDHPGRKTVLYISGGIPALSFEKVFAGQGELEHTVHRSEIAAARLNDPFRVLGKNERRHGGDIFEDLVRFANSHNITFYTIDPDDYLRYLLPDIADDNFRLEATRDEIKKNERAYLRYLAADTDGAVLDGPAHFGRFQEILGHDIGSYYELSYTPPRERADGEYHELKLKVRRPGVRARFRRGYFDYTPEQSRSLIFASASANPELFREIDFQARAVPFFSRRDRARLWILLALPVHGLILDDNPGRESKLLHSFFWLDHPRGGNAFSARLDIPILFTPEYRKKLEAARLYGYNTCSEDMKISGTTYRLTFALHDPDSERTGTVVQDMRIPDLAHAESPLIVGAVFGRAVKGRATGRTFKISDRDGNLEFGDWRFHPMGANRFGRAFPVHLFLQVFYPGKKPALNPGFGIIQDGGPEERPVPCEPVREAWNGKAGLYNLVYALDFSALPGGPGRLRVKLDDRTGGPEVKEIPIRLF